MEPAQVTPELIILIAQSTPEPFLFVHFNLPRDLIPYNTPSLKKSPCPQGERRESRVLCPGLIPMNSQILACLPIE